MIDRGVGCDPPRPRPETARRIEASVRAINPPERLDGQVFRQRRISDDPYNPTVHFSLVLPKQSFEGFEFAARELLEQFHRSLSIRLTGLMVNRFHISHFEEVLNGGPVLLDGR